MKSPSALGNPRRAAWLQGVVAIMGEGGGGKEIKAEISFTGSNQRMH